MSVIEKMFFPSTYALNPARTAAARRDFDLSRGFDRYAAFCKAQMQRDLPGHDYELHRRGAEVVRILSNARAGEVLQTLISSSSGIKSNDKGIHYSQHLAFEDPAFLTPIFEEILQGSVDERIARQFGSEYLIYSFSIVCTLSTEISRRSFLWHCDRGPRDFLKILLYLNGTESHGGSTEFLDRDATSGFERIGYVFGPNKRRVSDLGPIAKRYGLSYQPTRPAFQPGEAIMLEPARILHRGFMPTRGKRHLISMMLLPSPVPWRQAYVGAMRTRFCERNSGAWVGSADELMQQIGIAIPPGTAFAQA